MILYHTTTREAALSIGSQGILTERSQGKMAAVWVHTEGRSAWAFLHVCNKHKADMQDVVRLTISVPRRWLRRAQRGLWYSFINIPPSRIVGVTFHEEVSKSPVEVSER